MEKVAAEQKAGPVVCGCTGCAEELSPAAQFSVIAWCTRRKGRLAAELAALTCDQGNAGEEAEPEPSMPEKAVPSAATTAPSSEVERVTNTIIAAEKIKAALTEVRLDVAADRQRVAAWAALETTRVRAWGARRGAPARAAVDGLCARVKEVEARRQEGYTGLALQRLSLLVSFEEAAAVMDSPAQGRAAFGSALALEALAAALGEGRIQVPPAWAVAQWCAPPTLACELEGQRVDGEGPEGDEKQHGEEQGETRGEERGAKHLSPDASCAGNSGRGLSVGKRVQEAKPRAAEVTEKAGRAAASRLALLRDAQLVSAHLWPLNGLFPEGCGPVFPVMPQLVRARA